MKRQPSAKPAAQAAAKPNEPPALTWRAAHDPRFTIRGLAWRAENGDRFCRLPLRAEKLVRPEVWSLGKCPSSARVCFASDTATIAVRVANASPPGMDHMPATGQSGLALYAGRPLELRPWAIARPALGKKEYEQTLVQNVERRMREYTLYLPLYSALDRLEIGLTPGSRIRPVSALAIERPIVFYGTSITQGGCATTAGADYVSAVGRALNTDVINLGFSGNGKGEPELARLVAEIDASLYVLDYAANAGVEGLRKTLGPFYRILRQARPQAPILLMTRPCCWPLDFARGSSDGHEQLRDVAIHFYSRARRAGDGNLHFCDGDALIPFATDAAYVDGGHPNDLGFFLMAQRLTPVLARLLFADYRKG